MFTCLRSHDSRRRLNHPADEDQNSISVLFLSAPSFGAEAVPEPSHRLCRPPYRPVSNSSHPDNYFGMTVRTGPSDTRNERRESFQAIVRSSDNEYGD